MSKLDLYPSTDASPKDAQVATGTTVGDKVGLDANIIGGNLTVGTAAAPANYDSGEVSYPTPTREVYVYRKAGTIVRAVTINYTSSSKEFILDWSIL